MPSAVPLQEGTRYLTRTRRENWLLLHDVWLCPRYPPPAFGRYLCSTRACVHTSLQLFRLALILLSMECLMT